MIQRPQHLLMAGIAILMVLVLFLPLFSKTSKDGQRLATLNAYSAKVTAIDPQGQPVGEPLFAQNVWYISALAAASAVLAGITISQYRNRLRQMQFGMVISLLIAGTAIAMLLMKGTLEKQVDPDNTGTITFGSMLPFIALVLNMISNRLIRKDDKLVRSMDRLR